MISIQNITKSFGAQVVLDDISLEIEPGKITAIVGPSGVGKSVLLKLILGILQPDSGQISINGQDITKARTEAARNAIRSNTAVLFQSAALLDSLTVYENIAFPLTVRSLEQQKSIHHKVEELIYSLSLTELAHAFPQEVSIGCRKRVGLARALITNPEIVLFDEPNTGLDPLVGQEVYELIEETHKQFHYTGIVISHELPEVFQVSNRVVMLLGGKPVFDGTPKQMTESENEAVTQFLNGKIDGPIRIS